MGAGGGRDAASAPSAPAPLQFDVLTVNNAGLLDLQSEDSGAGLLPGPDIDLKSEVETVRKLLASDAQRPATDLEGASTSAVAVGRSGRSAAGAATGPTFGHSRARSHQIAYDNSRLVQRLTALAAAQTKPQATSEAHDRHVANMMASSLAKRRQGEDALIRANLALYRRLQAVRPSKDLDARALGAEYRRSRGYLVNLRTVPDAPPHALAAGQRRPAAWDERWQARPSTC